MNYTLHTTTDKGYATLVLTIITMGVSLLIIGGLSFFAFQEVNINRNFLKSVEAKSAAESGIEDAVYRLISGKQIGSTETIALGNTMTTLAITSNGNVKTIRAEGKKDTSQKNFEAVIQTNTQGVSFNYGVQVGYLGLDMQNTSQVIGSVYSNSSITAAPNTAITGDAWVAGGTGSTPDQAQTTQLYDLNLRDTLSRRDGAQSFIPSITAEVRKVRLWIKRTASDPPDASVHIMQDVGGIPDDAGSFANGNLNSSLVTTSYAWVDVTMNSNDPIINGQKYWIVVDNSGDNASRYYILGGADDTSYSVGTFLYSKDYNSSSPVWTIPSEGARDIKFEIYLGTVDTSISGATIGQGGTGDAHAHSVINSTVAGTIYCQTGSGNNKACNTSQADPAPQNFPISQGLIDQFKTEGDAGGICNPSGSPPNPNASPQCDADGDFQLDHSEVGTLGPIKIPRNLDLDNQAKVTIKGTVHVTGDLKLKNRCVMQLDPSYGATAGVIVVDGIVDIENQCEFSGSGNPASYVVIITTSPQISGPPAIRVSNSATGTILYASEGAIELQNQSHIKEAVGQKLVLKNQATVTYETGLNNVQFSAGPSGGYTIQSWKEVE